MQDLTRLGLTLVGFPVTVFAAGLLVGLGSRLVTRGRSHDDR
jgi:hypothetical protein